MRRGLAAARAELPAVAAVAAREPFAQGKLEVLRVAAAAAVRVAAAVAGTRQVAEAAVQETLLVQLVRVAARVAPAVAERFPVGADPLSVARTTVQEADPSLRHPVRD